jgi:hypothetical protein
MAETLYACPPIRELPYGRTSCSGRRRTAAGLIRRTKNLGVKANVRRKTVAQARERLVTITDDVWSIQPDILLASGSDLVIVCDSAGILAGVVTKTDVVSQICHCHGAGCITAASLAMTRDVAFCRPKGLAARCLGTHEGAEPKKYSCRGSGFPPPGTSPRTRHSASSSQKLRRRGINVARLCDGPGY